LQQSLFAIGQSCSVSLLYLSHFSNVADLLPRHRRTHEARPDGEIGNYSEDDLEAEENEFGTLEDESPPPPDHSYMQHAMNNMTANAMKQYPVANIGSGHNMPPPMMPTGHLLQQQI